MATRAEFWGFPLTSIVAVTTVLHTTVLHCDKYVSRKSLQLRLGAPCSSETPAPGN